MASPAASAASSSIASSQASSAAPRGLGCPPHAVAHRAQSWARPAAQILHRTGRSQIGLRSSASAGSAPGLGRSSPSGPTPCHACSRST
eukprot:9968935-Lingulodinium_polyedra.AAC.1